MSGRRTRSDRLGLQPARARSAARHSIASHRPSLGSARTRGERIRNDGIRRHRPRRRPGRLYGGDPRSPARRERRVRREGERARRHVSSSRVHPDEGLGPDCARALRRDEIDPRLGVTAGEPKLDFAQANEWKDAVSKQMTSGVADALQGERDHLVPGRRALRGRPLADPSRARTSDSASRARSSPPARIRSGRRSRGSTLLGASTRPPPRPNRGPEAARRPRRRHHRVRVRLHLRALRERGDDRRDARHAHPAGGLGRHERAPQDLRAARHCRPPRKAVHAGGRHGRGAWSSTSARARPSNAT